MNKMKKRFLELSLTSFITAAVLFVLNYICFHYTGDDRPNGIAFMFTAYHDECEKPFVTDLLGQLATLMLFTSIVSLMIVSIFYRKRKNEKALEVSGADAEAVKATGSKN